MLKLNIKKKTDGTEYICTRGSKHEGEIPIRILAQLSVASQNSCTSRYYLLLAWNRFVVRSLDGWVIHEPGNATYIDRLIVSSALLSTPILGLIGSDYLYFWSCHMIHEFGVKNVGKKKPTKIVGFEYSFVDTSVRFRVGFPYCLDLHVHYSATDSASNFHVIIWSGRDSTIITFIRFSLAQLVRQNAENATSCRGPAPARKKKVVYQ